MRGDSKSVRRRFGALAIGVLFVLALGIWRMIKVGHRPSGPPAHSGVPAAPFYPDPPGIVLHASDSPAFEEGRPVDAARLERVHAEEHPGWATVFEGKTYHIGYHYVILPDGAIQQGRPDHCPGCHTIHYNNWLGICVIGAFSTISNPHYWPSTPTKREVASVISLCERLMSKYHIPPERVKRHRDLRLTWCPGSRFPYKKIMKALQAYAATHPETRDRVTTPPRLAHLTR